MKAKSALSLFVVLGLILLTLGSALAMGSGSDLAIPFISQYQGQSTDNDDCGPADVAMVLEYYGKRPPGLTDKDWVVQVRTRSGKATGYLTFSDLETVLSSYGLSSVEISGTVSPQPGAQMEKMKEALAANQPVIALVHGATLGRQAQYGDQDHFVLVRGFSADGQQVYVNDPDLRYPACYQGWLECGGQASWSFSRFAQATEDAVDRQGGPYGLIVKDTGSSKLAGTATVLLFDISTSMDNFWQGGIKIESARQAALNLVDIIEQESQAGSVFHSIAVASFSTDARLDLPLTVDYDQARQTIQGLISVAATNIGAGLQQANSALAGAPAARTIIILLSDGQTNEGLAPPDILSGPVQQAVAAGSCIYTVGFGDPGDLDEDLLQRIAQEACGAYAYAETPFGLESVYIDVQHESTGLVIDRFEGQVAQGETTVPRDFSVPANVIEMPITLSWPGSRLELAITDPQGRQVDGNYPGAILRSYARMVHVLIARPLQGVWRMAVRGVEVPERQTDFKTIVSVRLGPTPVPVVPTPAPASQVTNFVVPPAQPGKLPGVLLLALVAGGALVALIVIAGRQAGQQPVVVVAGQPQRQARMRRGTLRIGRDPRCDLVISDSQASRFHARIVRTPQGFLLVDEGSTNGTTVNGHSVASHQLRDNDGIRIGTTDMIFYERRRS